jgi:predicted outer membrane repeat protein
VLTHAHYASLQAAVGAATAGDRLKVAGVCVGSTIVDRRLTIRGTESGSDQAVLDGDRAGRVLEIASGVNVRLEGLVIRGGKLVQESGGGILNHGKLTLTDVTLSTNRAFSGGGIYSTGELVLDGATTVKRNRAVGPDGDGGGIYVDGGRLTMTGSSAVHHNTSGRGGGGDYGIVAGMTLEAAASVHHNESTTGGGGIYADFDSVLALNGSSSVRHNVAGEHGGGVFDNSSVTMNDASSVEDNTATMRGGGVYVGCFAELVGADPGDNVRGNHRTNVAREMGCR